jgi:tyrosyl-tRNA synthetase
MPSIEVPLISPIALTGFAIRPERGFIHQISDPEGLDKRVLAGPVTAYIGFDCTAPSLHVGSMLPIMMLHWLQQTGTSRSPDGRRHHQGRRPVRQGRSRKLLSESDIEANKAGIKQGSFQSS